MSKRVTISDVAKKANVSPTLVSFVLNNVNNKGISEKTKQRVLQTIKEMDYIPNSSAKKLRTKKAMSIGFVSFWKHLIPFSADVLGGLNHEIQKHNYTTTICNDFSSTSPDVYINLFRTHSVDAIVLLAPYDTAFLNSDFYFDESEHLRTMKDLNIPFVCINGKTQFSHTNYLYLQFDRLAYDSTNYFIKHGFTKIAYVEDDYITELHNNNESVLRKSGYLEAMKAAGLPAHVVFVDALKEIWDSFHALVVSKALTAVSVIQLAQQSGIAIPKQISIIASNEEPFADFLRPSLTTVSFSGFEVGVTAASMVLSTLENGTSAVCNYSTTYTNFRQTTPFST